MKMPEKPVLVEESIPKIEKQKPKKKILEPQDMKTYLKIPYQRAPEDPSWLQKAHSGRKMDPIELEEYLLYKFDLDHKKLL